MGWLRMLGAVELLADDDVPLLPTGSARMRRLLALLALRAGGTVSVDAAAEVVWGADQPEHPDAAVQSLVSRLRRLMDDDPDLELVTRPGGYQLQVRDGHLDLTLFEQLAAQGSALLDEDPTKAAHVLDRALTLWPSGDAFGDLRGDEPFHTRAAALDEVRARAVEDRVGTDLRRGRHHEAAARLESLVAEAPLRERRRAQLVLARHRAGRTAEALAAYQEYRRHLIDELGVEPSAPLRALHEGILRDDPALAWHPPTTPVTGRAEAPGPPTSIPTGHDLVGRDRLLEQVTTAVAAGELVTLTGPGGVGKSSLAYAVADRLAVRLPDGAHVVELAQLTSPSDVMLAVASAVDVPLGPSGDARDRVVGWLARQEGLLVLDNCEHLLDPVATLVDRLHRRAPGLRVLLTSQTAVGVPGEHLVEVAPLPVTAPEGRPGAAVELFVTRARAHDPTFALTPDNTDDVLAVCRHLDGLPLAVELAAARMRAMTPGELAMRLSGRFRLLHGGSRTASDRHRTLRALVDWSYGLLEPGQQRGFDVLSVFAGDFSLAQAEALLPPALNNGLTGDEAADLVLTLVERSMLVRTSGEPTTYRLLETLRAYGRERLQARGDLERVRDVHARGVAALVGPTRTSLFTAHHARDAELVAHALDEMRAAFAWTCARDTATAATIVAGGAGMVELRMNPEVPHWAGTLLAGPLASPGHGVPDDLSAWVYAVAAAGARFAGELQTCEEYARRGAELASEPVTRSYTSYLLVEAALFRGDLRGARHRLEEAVALLDLGLPQGWGSLFAVMQALDAAYSSQDIETAVRLSEQALADAARHELAFAEAWATYARGEVVLEGDPGAAAPYLERAVQQAEVLGDRYLGGVALLSLASAQARSGDTASAADLFRRAVAHWRRAGNWTHQWATLRNAVVLLVRSGLMQEAAWLDGALAARGAWSRAAGAEAERASRVRAELVAELGRSRYDAAAQLGAGTNDGELVAKVLGQLAAIATSEGGAQRSR